ncbi:4-alpha-glucanotransferase [Anaeromicrobium sediminis]|uniref:4-alpha-glucanotransferase n=1 Tax=Anaeromicrobium sediminis TaxID=1478221 RepID=A0A267MLD6_9FIRM|nr:4-alpha-glucanotransferase [Anaeromicrobium sediminis]PAB59695.1 4-alpha-glucanotransferase [Anaeromicrobium sediminis]
MKRSSGIIMHITSLPGKYGIGTFGKEAFEFVDFLCKAGQSYWQILPIGCTGYGDSPYQSFSAFAGNPYFIDFDLLKDEGLLKEDDYKDIDFGQDVESVDYEKIFFNKMPILKKAYKKGYEKYSLEIERFKEEKFWAKDFALYMAVKGTFDLVEWQKWDEDIKLRKEDALERYEKELKDEIDYWIFLQVIFFEQWTKLKSYANEKGLKIIGDIPIYVAADSADAWANSEVFLLDEEKNPIKVAGCPPDAFSATGQLWGNPIYRWEYLDGTGYKWWIDRMKGSIDLYDVIRIDHFRGFESYWQVPYGEDTAINGEWVKGPGMKLFNAIQQEMGHIDVIAEDLGYLTEEVIKFREDSGYPGMKVLQFAFDTREESDYLPHNYDKNCIVYTGTHDNDTVAGWLENGIKEDIEYSKKYLKLNKDEGEHWGFIRGTWSSVGNLAIGQMQDFLGLGSKSRMNIPSTIGGNWQWRVKKEDLTRDLAKNIYDMTKLYGR